MLKRARTLSAKQQRRRDILNAALMAFHQLGYAATTMDEVAHHAGVSKGTVYLYFPSKQALFKALVETHAEPRIESLISELNGNYDPLAGISALFKRIPELLRHSEIPKLVKVLLGDAQRFPELARFYRQHIVDKVLKALTDNLQRGSANGQLTLTNPAMTARLVVAPVVLSLIWILVFEENDEEPLNIEALLAEHQRLMHRALKPETENQNGAN